MPKLTNQVAVTIEQLKHTLSSALGSEYKLILKAGRLEVVQDELRGCVVKVKQKSNETDIFLGPFVPSTQLAVVMSLLCFGAAFALMFFVNVIVGIVLLPLSIIVRLLPSSRTVNETKRIIETL